MPQPNRTTIAQCTEAHGICEGMAVHMAGTRLRIGPGHGYVSGERIEGEWEFDMTGRSGWGFVKIAGGLCLGTVLVHAGRIMAWRDMRQHLTIWRWLTGTGSLCYVAQRPEVVARLQGAVQIGGTWEPAIAYAPFKVGQLLEPGEVYAADVGFDKPALQSGGMILETIGVMQ